MTYKIIRYNTYLKLNIDFFLILINKREFKYKLFINNEFNLKVHLNFIFIYDLLNNNIFRK